MALTREIEKRLDRAGLIAHFNANQARWLANCQDAYNLMKKMLAGHTVREDDVAKLLRASVEIDDPLRNILDEKKLSQKYWIDFFTALVIDRTWGSLQK